MPARRIKSRARLPLPWERENSPFRSLFSGRRFFPLLVLLATFAVLLGAHWLGARRADIRATRATLHEVSEAARAFVSDIGRCPRNAGELVHPPRSGVQYLHDTPTDAWGHPVLLRCSIEVSSAGTGSDASSAGSPSLAQSPRPGEHTQVEVWSAGPSGSFFDDDNLI